ncbi:MAG: BatA domain-containing protein [Planctomycetota bacterium]
MLAFAFLNPMLLWALPLAAVPVIIHILNRRRFQKVPWAAMEFLLKAMKRNRKRLRMEQWLVLLLRVLAVLLLGLLVARPQLGGGIVGTRTHHVVVLDDSASMTERSGSTTLYDHGQDRVRTLADDLAKTHNGDLFSIVRSSRGKQPDLWGARIGPDFGRRIGAAIKEWSVTDSAPDLGSALKVSVERAHEVKEASRTQYYLVTDMRQRDFTTDDDKPRPAMLAALAAMDAQREHLTVLGVGGSQPNLGIANIRLVDRLAIANVPATFAVDVKNYGIDATLPTTVAIEIDGQSRITQPVPQLAPGDHVPLTITHTFAAGGFHRVDAQLEATERYPLDDRRAFAIEVRDKSRVLLVDGDPDDGDGETFFLQTAFDPTGDGQYGIEPQVVSDTGLGEVDLEPFDYVWLCNVQAPPAALLNRLEEFVGKGGGLGFFCGQLVDAGRYNELLWRDGKGLLPLPLGDVAGDPDKPEHAWLARKESPLFARAPDLFEMLTNNLLLVQRYLTIVEEPGRDATVVMRMHDGEGPPLLVTKPFGSGGEVALFAITADRHWSNLPALGPLFVPIVNELHRTGARRRDTGSYNLATDGIYRLDLDPGIYRSDVTARGLAEDGDERTFTAGESKPEGAPAGVPGPLSLAVPMSELRTLGAYEVSLTRHDGIPEKRMFARTAPAEESRLVGFSGPSFERQYPPELQPLVTFVAAEGGLGAGPGEGEVWKILTAALIAGLLLESLLAWRFGRR